MHIPIRPRLIPRSLQGTLLLTYVLLLALALGGLVGWAGFRLQASKVEQARKDVELQAVLAAVTLDESEKLSDDDFLEDLVKGYARTVKGSIAVLDARLDVVGGAGFEVEHEEEGRRGRGRSGRETQSPSQPITAFGDFPERHIQEARQRIDPRNPSVVSWASGPTMVAAAPIHPEDRRAAGYVLLAAPLDAVNAAIRRDWTLLLLGAATVLVAVAAASLLLARRIGAPLRRVTAVTESMAKGDLSQRATPSGPEELRTLASSFNRMADRIEDTLARQRAFVADAAHELRTPLTSLKLRSEMIQQHGQDDAGLRARYLTGMAREIDSLQRLAEHLLSLSRMDSGQPFHLKPMDIAPLLYDVADEMAPLFANASLAFHVLVPPHLPQASIDGEAMRMAVRNLLDNAIQYTPARGEVTLKAEEVAGGMAISVSDTGQGIPTEALSRIFDRFYRVDRARSRRRGGAGLGLSLVKAIVGGHCGTIAAQSQVGKGSVFTIRLPVRGAGAEP